MDKEGNEVAEEQVELEQHILVHRQLRDLAVLQRNHRLRRQRGAGHAGSRTVPGDRDTVTVGYLEHAWWRDDRGRWLLTHLVRDRTPVTGELVEWFPLPTEPGSLLSGGLQYVVRFAPRLPPAMADTCTSPVPALCLKICLSLWQGDSRSD